MTSPNPKRQTIFVDLEDIEYIEVVRKPSAVIGLRSGRTLTVSVEYAESIIEAMTETADNSTTQMGPDWRPDEN